MAVLLTSLLARCQLLAMFLEMLVVLTHCDLQQLGRYRAAVPKEEAGQSSLARPFLTSLAGSMYMLTYLLARFQLVAMFLGMLVVLIHCFRQQLRRYRAAVPKEEAGPSSLAWPFLTGSSKSIRQQNLVLLLALDPTCVFEA